MIDAPETSIPAPLVESGSPKIATKPIRMPDSLLTPEAPAQIIDTAWSGALGLVVARYTIKIDEVTQQLTQQGGPLEANAVQDEIERRKAALAAKPELANALNDIFKAEDAKKAADRALIQNDINPEDKRAKPETVIARYFDKKRNVYFALDDQGNPTDQEIRLELTVGPVIDELANIASGQIDTENPSNPLNAQIKMASRLIPILGSRQVTTEDGGYAFDKNRTESELLSAEEAKEADASSDRILTVAADIHKQLLRQMKANGKDVFLEKTNKDGKIYFEKNPEVNNKEVIPDQTSTWLTFLTGMYGKIPNTDVDAKRSMASLIYKELKNMKPDKIVGNDELANKLRDLENKNQIMEQLFKHLTTDILQNQILIPNGISHANLNENLIRKLFIAHATSKAHGLLQRPNGTIELKQSIREVLQSFPDYGFSAEDNLIITLAQNDRAGMFFEKALGINLKDLEDPQIISTLSHNAAGLISGHGTKGPLDDQSLLVFEGFLKQNLERGMSNFKEGKNLGPWAVNGLLLLFMFMPQLTALFAEDGTEKGQQPG